MSSVPHVRRIGKALYYRDTLVGKGSDLAKAIEDKDAVKAEAIYQTCMVEYYKWFPRPNRSDDGKGSTQTRQDAPAAG